MSESDLVDIAKSFKKGEDFEVRRVLDDFGKVLIHVDKSAPYDLKKEMIKEYYGPYVSNDLLEKWLEEPSTVPGRYVSSPWPDRIEIKNVTRLDKDRFLVDADVVEVVSGTGRLEDVWRAPVSITVEYISGKWLITSFESL